MNVSGVPRHFKWHWCISTCVLPHDLPGENLRSIMRMLSWRNILFRLVPLTSWFVLSPMSLFLGQEGKKCSVCKPFVSWISGAELRSLSTALSKSHTAAIVPKHYHPAPKRIQKLPRWASFLWSQVSISNIMMLDATKTSIDSFQKKPSQITAAWIMEQYYKRGKI